MARIVLVHGAWQGAWCWERLTPLLREAGHEVEAPTLTGSGARAGELTPDVDLSDHVADVLEALRSHDDPAVLVLHSYAGMLAPAVVDEAPERVAAVVFVDSFHPGRGQSALDQMPGRFADAFRERARTEGDGWRLPRSEALLDVWGLHSADDRRWVWDRLTDWSIRCFESPSPVGTEVLRSHRRWYVAGSGPHPSAEVFGAVASTAAAEGCTVVEAPVGHDVMIEAPEDLARVVLEAAGGS